ncbi:hypothetical protein, partial [Rhizobium leguminosarum]|uniref:hypothetical protein n=1 Tax=Rhizobium leguminosarum TaxID=384 RepID=UPI003F9A0680
NGNPFKNYEFVDSATCPGGQISGVVAGTGKQRCLQLLVDPLDRSISENVAFENFVVSHGGRRWLY